MKSGRRIYRTNSTLKEASEIWGNVLKSLRIHESQSVPVTESLGRVTSEAVVAKVSSPFFHSSAMDGYAVRFNETFGAAETTPVHLKIGEEAVPVNTGDPIPDGFNAVIMIEDINLVDDCIEIIMPATPYQHVRVVGENIVQTELIVPENHTVRPVDIGAMLSGGNVEIKVKRRPFVTIVPTGDEVVKPGEALKMGSVIDFNSYMVGGIIDRLGGRYEITDVVPDDKEALRNRLKSSLESDLIVFIAGASAGTKDFTPDVIKELGTIHVHGINIKPGKPVLLGTVGETPVIGLPGYPVASYLTFELFGKPLIARLLGIEPEKPDVITAYLSRAVTSSLGFEEFIRVKVGKVGETVIATPAGSGSGAIMTLQRADGIVRVDEMQEGIAAGTEVEVELIRSGKEIENTAVCIGSHDNSLDLLANFLKRRFPSLSLSSAHIGSMGGIMAIKKSEAHVAGTHLLDEATGEYNVPVIKKFLDGIPLQLINLVYRQQGLIVRKGNPLGIKDMNDLVREDVMFINRQPGSGTRLLTDKCLRESDISPAHIKGYDKEEFTHMGVASAVASAAADAGMGILTAAIALDLEFIPVARERYDLLISKESLELPMIKALVQIISADSEFRESVLSLGGYDVSDMGNIMYEQ